MRSTNGDNPKVWNIDAWVGQDLNKLWIKAEGERVGSNTEQSELQLLYSKAVAPFWDL